MWGKRSEAPRQYSDSNSSKRRKKMKKEKEKKAEGGGGRGIEKTKKNMLVGNVLTERE